MPLPPQVDEVAASEEYLRRGLEFVVESPGTWVRLATAKVLCMIDPFTVDRQWRIDTVNIHKDFRMFERVQIAFDLLIFFLVLSAAMSRHLLADPARRIAAAGCLFWVLLGGVFFVAPRFRLMFLPFACLIAGANVDPADRSSTDARKPM